MSQCDEILKHLKAGNRLTPFVALNMFGTLALHSRIAELRSRGHRIDCHLIETIDGKRVGCYTLAPGKRV